MFHCISQGNPDQYSLQKNSLQFETVSGEVVTSLGTVSLDLKLGSHIFSQQIVVADIPQGGILGVDFLEKFNSCIDFKKKVLRVEGKVFALVSEPRKLCCKVSLIKDTYIPPCSEIIVWGRVKSRKDWYPEGQIEPLSSMLSQNYSVLVGRTMVNTKGNRVPIRMMNVSEEPCLIPANLGIGILHPVEICNQIFEKGHNSRDPLLQKLIDETTQNLDEDQKPHIEKLLDKYADVFVGEDGKLGRTDILQHVIDTGDNPPFKIRPYRLPVHMREEVEKQVNDMLEQGVISPSSSPYCSPVLLTKKSDGSFRFCIDYRRLNEQVYKKDAYPLPRIDSSLDALQNSVYYSTVDMASGYWQAEVHPDSREKTAFSTGRGLYEFNTLPFGLANAPSFFLASYGENFIWTSLGNMSHIFR